MPLAIHLKYIPWNMMMMIQTAITVLLREHKAETCTLFLATGYDERLECHVKI